MFHFAIISIQEDLFEVYKTFKSYGLKHKIEKVFKKSNDQQHVKAIEIFRRCERIIDITSQGKLELNGISYPMKFINDAFYERKFKPATFADELLTPPDMNSSQQILKSLNDDCLLKILLQGNFRIRTFINIASTCTRLNDIANQAFPAEYRRCEPFGLSWLTIATHRTIFPTFRCIM